MKYKVDGNLPVEIAQLFELEAFGYDATTVTMQGLQGSIERIETAMTDPLRSQVKKLVGYERLRPYASELSRR